MLPGAQESLFSPHRRRDVHRQHLTPAPHSGAAHQHPAVPELGAPTHHIDNPHERNTPMTHTHTIATLAELRTALAAGAEPSPCLARRTGAVLAGSHARFLVRIADGREATAALLYARIAAHLQGQTTAVAAYTIAAQCAFLAGDFSAARKLIAAAEEPRRRTRGRGAGAHRHPQTRLPTRRHHPRRRVKPADDSTRQAAPRGSRSSSTGRRGRDPPAWPNTSRPAGPLARASPPHDFTLTAPVRPHHSVGSRSATNASATAAGSQPPRTASRSATARARR